MGRRLRIGGEGERMEWARILAHITGTVDQELLLRNEYLIAENRILKAQLQGRPRLSNEERAKLSEIGHRLGRKALDDVATISATGYHLGVVPKARRSQIRWITSTSIPGPTADRQGR
jgi:hypothetical protein